MHELHKTCYALILSFNSSKFNLLEVVPYYTFFFQEDDKDKHTSTTNMFCVTLDCTIINIKTSLFSLNFQMNFIAIALDNHTVYLEGKM